MIRLLFFMNLTGFLFFILCTILFPYRKDFLPSRVRIFICRLNMMFYIIPFPLFLPYLRKFTQNRNIKIPFDPSLKNGSHIAIRFIDDIYLMLPKYNSYNNYIALANIKYMFIYYKYSGSDKI